MDARTALQRAIDQSQAIVGGIDASMMDRPTPCAKWKVREILNHVMGDFKFLEGALTGEPVPDAPTPGGMPDKDLVGEDAAASHMEGGRRVLNALRQPGNEERAGMALSAITSDFIVHAWDLAQATGQGQKHFDPELAEHALAFVKQGITPDNRGVAFGPPVDVPDAAPAMDRLVGYLGRTPKHHAHT